MNSPAKFVKVFLTLVFVFGISYVPVLRGVKNPAQVISSLNPSFFNSSNTNETVLKAQNQLKYLGLYRGRLSGLFGIKTKRAVIDFQNSNNLVPSGILDIPTQELLFDISQETSLEIPNTGYTQIPFSEEGNLFLSNWASDTYLEEGLPVDVTGELIQISSFAQYGQNGDLTRFILRTNNSKYSIENISNSDILSFVGMTVRVNGLVMPGINNLSYQHIVINNISDNSSQGQDLDTIDDNMELQNWILNTYEESGVYSEIFGIITDLGFPTVYRPGGNPTNFIFYTNDGRKYSVENISENRLDALLNQQFTIRGFVLENLNPLGIRTIVVNYTE